MRGGEAAEQMHMQHRAHVLLGHADQCARPQDAGVVDQDVDAAEMVQCQLHHGLGVGPAAHVAGIGNGMAPGRDDFPRHGGGCSRVRSLAVHRATIIVDHHPGAKPGQGQRVLPA